MTSQLGRRLTRHTVGLTGLIAAVLIMTSVMVLRPLRAADVTKSGWWIKVQTSRQESPTITFSIGSNNHTVEFWRTWNSSEAVEFDVPERIRNINPLYIKAQSSGGRNAGSA